MTKNIVFTVKAAVPNETDVDLLAQSFQAVFADFDPTELESLESSGIDNVTVDVLEV